MSTTIAIAATPYHKYLFPPFIRCMRPSLPVVYRCTNALSLFMISWHKRLLTGRCAQRILMLGRLHIITPVIFAACVIFVGIFVSGQYRLYEMWGHFDTAMHVLGGLTAAWFGLVLLQKEITHLPAWKQVLIFVSFATLAGVLWEFVEYSVGVGRDVVPWLYRWLHGGDLADTITDLTADIIGALTLSLWALRKERR